MKKYYDICIAGFWYAYNYGSVLNGYSTYILLKQMGKDVLMIQKPNANKSDIEITSGFNTEFIKKYYDEEDISSILPYNRLGELNDMCDCFCAGSDQIWNYSISFQENMYLPFVENGKKIISFATSFGYERDVTPREAKARVGSYLRRFNAISVRGQSDADILRDDYRINAVVLFEPTLCVDKKIYMSLAENSQFCENEPYLLAYILDPTSQIREAIKNYSKKTGLKALIILDGNPHKREGNKKILNDLNILENMGVEDFLKAFMNASFVFTDSFHGTVFSVVFQKRFLTVGNYKRGFNRFADLLSRLNLLDRLIPDTKNIPVDEKYLQTIDYVEVNKIVAQESEKTVNWIKHVIEMPKEQMSSIILPDTISSKLDRELCTGCSACVNSCPIGAITLEPDECGYYRATVNYEKCIGCETCIKVCPAVQLPQNNNFKGPELYEFIAADENVLYSSSSGGVFPLLAKETLKRNGVVVGAAWREDFSVEHIIIDSENDLHKLQKSKYLQSYMGDVFQRIKEKLDKSIFVLFSGCPCQVAGLKAFLKNDYENLILVDLLCGNAPSTSFFQKYVRDDFEEPLAAYEFRHKEQGWNWDCTTTTTTTTTGNVIVRRGEKQDSYQRVYHNHVMCPKHCEKCKYQNAPRFGDLTIGDFWGIGEKDKTIDTRKGVSAVLCNNEKGKEFFECIPQESVLVKKKVPLAWLGGNGFVNGGCNFASPKRDAFYEAIKAMSFPKAINYALKPNKGIYHEKGLLNYDAKAVHFSFDTSVWEEHYINGATVLITKQTREKAGKFVTMPLDKMLRKGCSYILKMRFKVKSDSDIINFHVKDSGTRLFQVLYSHKISHSENKWIEINKEFVPDSNIYDEFMIGSGQLYGEGRFLAIDYIDIIENYKG